MKLALVRLLLLVGLAPAVLAAQDARGYGIQWYDVPEENYFRQFKEVFESDMAKQFAENNYHRPNPGQRPHAFVRCRILENA